MRRLLFAPLSPGTFFLLQQTPVVLSRIIGGHEEEGSEGCRRIHGRHRTKTLRFNFGIQGAHLVLSLHCVHRGACTVSLLQLFLGHGATRRPEA